jgi:hypothetical protein
MNAPASNIISQLNSNIVDELFDRGLLAADSIVGVLPFPVLLVPLLAPVSITIN